MMSQMLKQGQGSMQETMADMSTASTLPPLNNLPQWSRVNNLDKARYPKPFLKDRLQPLPNPQDERRDSLDSATEDRELELTDKMNPAQRIQHLEKSINFLRDQHHEILSNLHEEIDVLKRENKELQFKIVMVQKGARTSSMSGKKVDRRSAVKEGRSRSGSWSSQVNGKLPPVPPGAVDTLDEPGDPHSEQHSQVSDEKLEELKIIFLEEEIKELKKSLREEKHKNRCLAELLEQAEKTSKMHGGHRHLIHKPLSASSSTDRGHSPDREQHIDRQKKPTSAGHATSDSHGGATMITTVPQGPLPYNATLEPFLVHIPSQPARPPTQQECEVIVRHLQQLNERQHHELNQLKTDLRDVLYSHKWTPDAYLLAKAYIAEDDAREEAEAAMPMARLPKVPLRQPTRKLPDIAYIQNDAISLPALKQTVGNKAVERRKRTQILQKARLRREVLH